MGEDTHLAMDNHPQTLCRVVRGDVGAVQHLASSNSRWGKWSEQLGAAFPVQPRRREEGPSKRARTSTRGECGERQAARVRCAESGVDSESKPNSFWSAERQRRARHIRPRPRLGIKGEEPLRQFVLTGHSLCVFPGPVRPMEMGDFTRRKEKDPSDSLRAIFFAIAKGRGVRIMVHSEKGRGGGG